MNIFDFDGTIYAGDSSIYFYLFALKENIRLIKYLPKQLNSIIMYKLNRISKEKMKEDFFCFIKGINVTYTVENFWQSNSKKIYKWYLEIHAEDDIVISASPVFLLEPICRKIGIKYLIATELDPILCRIQGKNCKGVEKKEALYLKYGITKCDNFYSDSLSDLSLAEIADNAFMIKRGKIKKWM